LLTIGKVADYNVLVLCLLRKQRTRGSSNIYHETMCNKTGECGTTVRLCRTRLCQQVQLASAFSLEQTARQPCHSAAPAVPIANEQQAAMRAVNNHLPKLTPSLRCRCSTFATRAHTADCCCCAVCCMHEFAFEVDPVSDLA